MDIGFYIADLLRDRDEVGLPGLGTFTKERVAGSFDQKNNSFNPPSYQIMFNDRESDFNLLSEYISNKKKLSAASAEYFVKKFTSAISDLLQTSGIAEIKPLGIIRQKNDHLTFEASANLDIGGIFYGLKPVPELERTITHSVGDASIPVNDPAIENSLTRQSGEDVEEDEVYEEEIKSNRKLIVAGAVLFTLIAAGLVYFLNPATRNLVDNVFVAKPSAVPAPKNARSASTLVTKDSLALPPPAARDSTSTDSAAAPKVVETTTFEIIGAAFGKRSEAERYIKSMKAKGLQARILDDMPGPLFKVSLASFPDYRSAQNELNRIKKEVEETAWTTPYKSKKTQ